jgi:hypothetical protein
MQQFSVYPVKQKRRLIKFPGAGLMLCPPTVAFVGPTGSRLREGDAPFLKMRIAGCVTGIPNLKPIAGEYEAFNLKNDETSL